MIVYYIYIIIIFCIQRILCCIMCEEREKTSFMFLDNRLISHIFFLQGEVFYFYYIYIYIHISSHSINHLSCDIYIHCTQSQNLYYTGIFKCMEVNFNFLHTNSHILFFFFINIIIGIILIFLISWYAIFFS